MSILNYNQSISYRKKAAEQTAHTPGPWAPVLIGNQWRVTDSRLNIVATLPTQHPRFQSETEANAKLIAAAPEMLEALRVALPALEAWTEEGKGLQAWSQAKDAIRKATGE